MRFHYNWRENVSLISPQSQAEIHCVLFVLFTFSSPEVHPSTVSAGQLLLWTNSSCRKLPFWWGKRVLVVVTMPLQKQTLSISLSSCFIEVKPCNHHFHWVFEAKQRSKSRFFIKHLIVWWQCLTTCLQCRARMLWCWCSGVISERDFCFPTNKKCMTPSQQRNTTAINRNLCFLLKCNHRENISSNQNQSYQIFEVFKEQFNILHEWF